MENNDGEMITIDDAGFAGFVSYFGGQKQTARLSHKHGRSWVFNSSVSYDDWSKRYYGSDYSPVNDATVRMLKMRG